MDSVLTTAIIAFIVFEVGGLIYLFKSGYFDNDDNNLLF